jgi:nucleoside transporter
MQISLFGTGSLKLFPSKPLLHFQLSVMMFLQFLVMGSTMPIVTLYMKDYLHFTGIQIRSVLAVSALASFAAPIASTFIADRFISAERFLSLIHALSAILMFYLSTQTSYLSFTILFVIYSVILNPSGALTNAISFHHLPDSKLFGGIRLWGTIGWISAAWIFGIISSGKVFFIANDLHSALQLSAISSFILSIYALFLPKGIKKIDRISAIVPTDSLKVVLNPIFILLSIFSGLIMLIDRFYIFGAAPFLKSIGYAERDIMPILSIGQIPEIFILLVMGILIKYFGFKLTILTGIILEILRFTIFAFGNTDLFLLTGIMVHGITWALFFVPITIFIDCNCSRKIRAGVQQLYSFISGTGIIAGNLIAGMVTDFSKTITGSVNYTHYWLVPMSLSIVVLIIFSILFKESPPANSQRNFSKEEKVPSIPDQILSK